MTRCCLDNKSTPLTKSSAAIGSSSDVRIVEDTQRIVAKATERFAALHILYNNAATMDLEKSVQDMTVEEWDGCLNATLRSVFLMSKWAAPEIRKAGGGVIINTSSVAGIEGQTGQIAYSASKGGIIGMTVPGARDLAAIGVRVNTICPGIIDTPIYGFSENAEEFKARLVAPVVFPKRMGRPDEFGHLVRSLIENDYMNADVVRFDGGIRFQPKL